MTQPAEFVKMERERMRAEFSRRTREVASDRYAPWDIAQNLFTAERKRVCARMLHDAGVFPQRGHRCLEIGFGQMGWLADLIGWGVRVQDLSGIDLQADRVASVQEILPGADLRLGDATELPWDDACMDFVILSTVMSSILDARVRRLVADEVVRVLAPGGSLIWYDFAVNNPRNPHVRGVGRRELLELFSPLGGSVRSVTLLPPVARCVAQVSWTLTTALAAIPWLRTHLLAVLVKPVN